ncbi:Anti-sigma-K factor rskA [Caballeronia fortuita]|uniref:Anti-sigma-K factor rskA n=1 Tax=Caballeronia fortuita TaxID=1777138 RepID=A0A158E0B8_9BURK|nr:anti-sigma factor [Caballeronia fortuita]SAL00292.1 Anti-sigma-K factor rskA [Caballeronia fortuita]
MNTPIRDDDDLRCAEYALGVLDAQERAAFEADASRDARLQRALEAWQARLAPLAHDVRAVEPPARVWLRIRRDLGLLSAPTEETARTRTGVWNNLSLWRWLTIGVSAAALVLLGVNFMPLREAVKTPATASAPASYMVATIARKDGVAHWTATLDMQSARMVVVPAVLLSMPRDRTTELWLIPPNAKPIPLGVFPSDHPATMTLPPEIMAQMSAQAVLAVSDEPAGGSPTGAPTGPILATGAMHTT